MANRSDLIAQVREALEKEIAELEKKLQLYQLLLSMLDACRGEQGAGLEEAKEFKGRGGAVYARLLRGRGEIVLVFTEPAPSSNPYAKYMLKALQRLREEYGAEVDIDEASGGIRRIRVAAEDEDALEEAATILEFAASKLKPR